MKIFNAILSTVMTIVGLTGCNTLKTSHHVVIDHNININVNNFNIGVTHKSNDSNNTLAVKSHILTMSNVIANIGSVDINGTN